MGWRQKYIKDLIVVTAGITFRSRIENEPAGGTAVIQARDLSETGQVQIATSSKVNSLPGSNQATLRVGDVLLQPRGTRFSAAVLSDLPMPVAAAAPLLVLRCNPAKIDPEFLVLFLQLPRTQALLRSAAAGTYIPQVPREAVASLPIDVPGLAQQRKLVEFNRMRRREGNLIARITAKRERLLELAVRDLAR